MKVMIIGCGRVGSVLANRLDEVGHQVVVLDRNQQAFRRLSEGPSGRLCASDTSRKGGYPFRHDG
jgi:trk system potassium uptake protein TrkA